MTREARCRKALNIVTLRSCVGNPAAAIGLLGLYCLFATAGWCAIIAPYLGTAMGSLTLAGWWLTYIDSIGGWRGLYLQGAAHNGVPAYACVWHN
jgi:hypothetical protein